VHSTCRNGKLRWAHAMNYVFTHHLQDSQAWRQGTKQQHGRRGDIPGCFLQTEKLIKRGSIQNGWVRLLFFVRGVGALEKGSIGQVCDDYAVPMVSSLVSERHKRRKTLNDGVETGGRLIGSL